MPAAFGRYVKIIGMALLMAQLNPVNGFSRQGGRNKKPQQRENGRDSSQGNLRRNAAVEVGDGNIVLGSPTAHSITASVLLQKDGEAFIEFSTQKGRYRQKTGVFTASYEGICLITLDKLMSNTSYYYRLNYRGPGEKGFHQTAESWFATQKKYDAAFSFAVQGDSHPEREGKMFSPSLYRQTIEAVAKRQPDFYMMMGDDFSIDRYIERQQVTRENIEKTYLTQRHYLGSAAQNPPLFLVNGNHEQAAQYLLDGTAGNAAVLAANARKKYFPLPAPGNFYTGDKDTIAHVGLLKDYYAFEWGNALFVVIDPYWHSDIAVDNVPGDAGKKSRKDPWGITIGDAQYQWFKQVLETSSARFKFVFSHHVLGTGRGGVERAGGFEWGGHGQNGVWQFNNKRPGWELPIHQLMVKNKVTVFFQGHDHIFAKQELDGIIYQSVPNPADDTYTAFNREAYTSGVILPNSGFLQVTVKSREVNVEYVRSFAADNPALPEAAKTTYSYTIK